MNRSRGHSLEFLLALLQPGATPPFPHLSTPFLKSSICLCQFFCYCVHFHKPCIEQILQQNPNILPETSRTALRPQGGTKDKFHCLEEFFLPSQLACLRERLHAEAWPLPPRRLPSRGSVSRCHVRSRDGFPSAPPPQPTTTPLISHLLCTFALHSVVSSLQVHL